jgi:hypothetical protein
LGLAVAVYSLLSAQTKLSLSFKINWIDKIVIVLFIVLIHYIAFTPVLNELGVLIPLGNWRWGFDEKSATYLIFLLLTLFVVLRLNTVKLGRGNIEKFAELIERLLFEKKYDELVNLTENHINSLFYLVDKGNDEARLIVNRVLSSPELIDYVAISKPKFGIELLKNNFAAKESFVHQFISALIDKKGSQFYYEMSNIQNTISMHRLNIPPQYSLSHYLFSDATVSKSLDIYKPVGDKIVSLLTENEQLIKRSNNSFGNFYETEKESDAVECGLHFFEIMIIESMHQNLKWHMWLYYFPIFSKGILEKLEPTPDVDLNSEWPTPYHYYLYRLIQINFDWIEEFPHIKGCENVTFNSISLEHDNGSILKSAILSAGQLIWQITESSKIEDKFKRYCLEIALRHLRDFKKIKVLKSSYRVLMLSVLFNGFYNKKNLSVLNTYENLLTQIDHVLRIENKDFTTILRESIKEIEQ